MSPRRFGGDVTQGALRQSPPVGTVIDRLIEGVVVFAHYPDDSTNQSKVTMEYDVDPTSVYGMNRLRNVARGDVAAGIDDGEDNVLRVAVGTANGQTVVLDGGQNGRPTPRYETDGDRVIVGFINGSVSRPIILGVLPHFYPRMRERGKPLKDVRGQPLPKGALFRRMRHRGTELVLDQKGNVTLVLGKTPDRNGKDTDDKKTLTLVLGDFTAVIDNTTSPTTVKVTGPNGAVFKLTKDGLEIGVSPTDYVALASLVKQEITALRGTVDALVTKFNTHGHVVATTGTAAAQSGTAAPTTSPATPPAAVQDVKSVFTKSK